MFRTPHRLISMPEIAELAGVRRPVVTTWRRRYPDFPAPVEENAGRALFAAEHIVDWLVGTGRAQRNHIEAELCLYLLSGLAANGLAAERYAVHGLVTDGSSPRLDDRYRLPPREFVATITALICLSHLDGEPLRPGELLRPDEPLRPGEPLRQRAIAVDPADTLLRGELESMPTSLTWLTGAVDELIEAAWGTRGAYERILAARQRFQATELSAAVVTPALAKLVAGVCGAREHADRFGSIQMTVDGVGAGDVALAILGQVGEGTDVSLTIADPEPFLARLARRRLLVHGRAPDDVTIFDGPAPPADVSLLQLPYQPYEWRAAAQSAPDPLAAVKPHLMTLAPGQTLVVLGPADLLVGPLQPYRQVLRTRCDLLASGRVEAVINLPGGLMPFRPAYQSALWVLRHDPDAPGQGRVLLADVAHRTMTDQLVDDLVWDITTWRRAGHQPGGHYRAHAAEVATDTLMRARVPLTTRRRLRLRDTAADPQLAIARITELEADLSSGTPSATPAPLRTHLAARPERYPPPQLSIGDLVRRGLLAVHRGHRIVVENIGGYGQHQVIGVPELTGASPLGVRLIDRGVLAQAYPRVRLTEPDDLVVTVAPSLRVHRDRAGFSLVEYPARILRVTEAGRDHLRPRVLAESLRDLGRTVGRADGAVRPGHKLDDLPVPVWQPAILSQLDTLFTTLDERREQALRTVATLDEVRDIAIAGFTVGTLGIQPP